MDFLEMSIDINKLKKFTAGLFDKIEGNRIRLNNALEKGTAVAFHGIYHETINTRIKNICNVLGIDLNDTTSKFLGTEPVKEARQRIWDKITALEEEQKAFIEVSQLPCKDCKLNDLKNILQDHIQLDSSDPDLLNYNTYEAYNDALLVKLDAKQEKKDLLIRSFTCPNCGMIFSHPDEFKTEKKDCLHEFLLEAHWSGNTRLRCNKCGMEADFHEKTKQALKEILKKDSGGEKEVGSTALRGNQKAKSGGSVLPPNSKLPELCKECGGYRMGERMMHNDWCSQCSTGTTAEKPPAPEEFPKCSNSFGHSWDKNYKCIHCGIFIDEKSGAKESKGEYTVPEIRSHPEVNVAIQPASKPTEMCVEYLDGSGKLVKYDGLIQKSDFVKELKILLGNTIFGILKHKIRELIKKYT